MSGLDLNTYYGKISKKARVFNKLDPKQVREGIECAQEDFNRDARDITTVHLEDGNLDVEKVNLKNERSKDINNKKNDEELDR